MSTFARLCRSAVLFVSAAAPFAAAQQTRRVPQDFPTIQAAINASSTGDTVLVAPGTYFENLILDTREITLTSSAGPATTILDGQHLGPVLQVIHTPGVATTISGFTVQNGSPLGSSSVSLSVGPAGVLIANAGAQISNSTFQQNAGVNVGVINGSLTLTASSLSTASTGIGSCSLGAGATFTNPSTGVYLSGTSAVLTNAAVPAPSVITGNTIFGDGTRCSGPGIQAINLGQPLTLESNIIRNNSLGVAVQATQLLLIQNLIYDNVAGGLSLLSPSNPPNVEPITTFVINNTIVNNLTSPDPAALQAPTDIFLNGTVSRTAFVNNILVGTTPHPVLTCATAVPSINHAPLLFDHNDLYNTTNAANSTLSGDCLTAIGGSPASAPGNLSVDPRLAGSTDLHPLPGSPVIDAGNNSAPGLLFDAFSLASTHLTTLAPLLSDIAGNRRIADSGHGTPVVDMGAYEASGSLLLIPTASVVFASAPASQLSLLPLSGYTITATGLHPAGTITFLDNGMPYGPITPGSDGIAHGAIGAFGPAIFDFQAVANLADPSFAPSTSMVIYVDPSEMGPAAPSTTLTLAATPATQTLNQPITLTIHLGSATTSGSTTTAGPIPPGDVTLSEGSTLLSTLQPDTTGLATYTVPKPGLGSHTYTVTYAGTSLFPAATASTSVSITAPIATSLTARPDHNPIALGEAVGCTATVVAASGPAPTGTVVFTDGASPEGSITLDNSAEQGLATVILYNLTFGLHTITVTFQPDPGFSPSTGTCTINVGGHSTITTLTSAKNPAATTDAVTYTATVANTSSSDPTTTPAGSVSLSEGTTLLASAPLAAGALGSSTVSLSATLTLPGSHILTATYLPATSATFTSSATLTETITALPVITTTLSATPNPVAFGQPATLFATISSAGAIPSTASITFTDGGTVLGTVPLPSTNLATISVSTLSVGTHQIGAVLHTSDTTAVRSTALPLTLEVNGLPDTLTLAVSPSPTAFATVPVTLTATLAPTSALPSGSTLSGAITFLDGNLPLGTATFAADGRATLSTATLAPGNHTLSASFGGNLLLAAATSIPFTEQITTNPTTTSLSVTPATSAAFAPITLAAHVASTTSTNRLNTLVCTPACSPITVSFFAASATGTSSLGIVPVDASGNAVLSLNPIAGTYSLTATFSGSPIFIPSSSAASPLTVSAAPSALTLTANPNPVYQHGSVTLTAALTAPGVPASALDGTVTFLEGSTPLGTATLAAAQAFAYSPGAIGPHTLTAIFSGTGTLSGASATATVTVLPSDFVLSLKDTTLTIAATHHAPTTITINTTGTLADQIDLSCANLPEFATCTFAPATHNLTETNTSSGTLTLDTDALLNYAGAHPPTPPFLQRTGALLALCLPLGLIATFSRRRSGLQPPPSRLPHLLGLLLLSLSAITLTGCSGLYPSHVAPGTYTVIVTGHARTSGIEHTTNLTLVVTP